eukprot:TRINITY_DN61991_c0_g1_i2.p1 TRINITY_DN61991_c0_g1~~TRINITY_DN61991_c0_g1_i2.p1  ORF type:complete len:247 (+),score=78.91 TRINITY_DN61991_c0_g1_i2:41-781(+)
MGFVVGFFFFFQAEDGIRDAQESRGLGDVYKRQALSIDVRNRAQHKVGVDGWRGMNWADRLVLCTQNSEPVEVDPFTIMRENATAAELEVASDDATKALLDGAKKGDLEAVQQALASGACIDGTNTLGFTAIALAAVKGHKQVVSALIDAGANLRIVLKQGTLLSVAIQFKKPEIAELLIARGAPVDMKSLQKLMEFQGTEDEAKFNAVMSEAVIRIESQDEQSTSRDFLLGQTMQSLMAAKLGSG